MMVTRLGCLGLLAGVLALTGCSSSSKSGYYWFDDEDAKNPSARTMVRPPKDSGLAYRPDSRDIEMFREPAADGTYRDPLQTGFAPEQTHKFLADYASQLAMSLMNGATRLSADELIGIASFVRLNHNLNEPTILGNQLAEYLITELQTYGLGIVDFKLGSSVNVTPFGDLVMSRDGKRLAKHLALDHVLTGTLVEVPRGVRVNARIVSFSSRQVVASAELFIPSFMVTALNPALPIQSDE